MSEKIAPTLIIDGDPIQQINTVDYLKKKYIPTSETAAKRDFRNERPHP